MQGNIPGKRMVSFLAAILLAGATGIASADDRSVTGHVYDTTGLPLQGVTVLLTVVERATPAGCLRPELAVARPAEEDPITSASSDAEGAFSVDLAPGRYRVAAFKRGYDVAVSDVNTLARSFFTLRLHPSPRVVLGDLPVGSPGGNLGLGWILRQQPSDVLRDERPVAMVEIVASRPPQEGGQPAEGGWPAAGWPSGAWPASTPPAAGVPGRALLGSVGGEFAHLNAGADVRSEGGETGNEPPDRSTDLALRGVLGDEGIWRVDAGRGRSSAAIEGLGGRQASRADRLAVGLDYALGPEDSLKTEVRYGRSRYLVDPADVTVDGTEQEQRTLGVRSRWDRTLEDGLGLYVDGTFFRTGVRLPDPQSSPFAGLAGADAARAAAMDRSWDTRAGIALATGSHHLDIGLDARSYRYDLRDQGILIAGGETGPGLAETGERGSALCLYGGDRWSAAQRYEIDYGVRYHPFVAGGAGYAVPRVGLTHRPFGDDSLTLRSLVLYRLDDAGAPGVEAADGLGPARPASQEAGRLGYIVGVERRPPGGLQVSATLSYRPFVEGRGDAEGETGDAAWPNRPLFLSDGAAARHELQIEVARNLGSVRGTVSGSVGTVQGRVSPSLEEAPVQVLSQGEMRYYRTGLRAFIVPSDTEVQVDFRSVQSESAGASAASPIGYRRLDLVVSQNLPWALGALGARLRLLMAYQGLFYGTLFDAPAAAAIPGTASRISGGVDIRF